MKNINVGIFHDDKIGRELGKYGTESDMVMYNRKTDDCIFTFLQPIGDKISAKTEIMSVIDAAIISVAEMKPEVGETILMLDSFGISRGIVIVPQYTDPAPLKALLKGTSLETFLMKESNPEEIFSEINKMVSDRPASSDVVVTIDHSFNVKGVGEVILGFVKKGVAKKHEKLLLLPANKEVIVRSIQMQDKDFDEAGAGSRVGIALKGAEVEELKRGSLLCSPGSVKTGTKIVLSFDRNKFYQGDLKEGAFYAGIGMQTLPVNVKEINGNSITIESEKQIAYSPDDVFLLLDLNARKVHVIGKGKARMA